MSLAFAFLCYAVGAGLAYRTMRELGADTLPAFIVASAWPTVLLSVTVNSVKKHIERGDT